ncbi:Hypothetical predicted protein [Olea europaea subsp. europaea]|nr:Hypothetical predicted protein [Olea europaea subsp. europaea]
MNLNFCAPFLVGQCVVNVSNALLIFNGNISHLRSDIRACNAPPTVNCGLYSIVVAIRSGSILDEQVNDCTSILINCILANVNFLYTPSPLNCVSSISHEVTILKYSLINILQESLFITTPLVHGSVHLSWHSVIVFVWKFYQLFLLFIFIFIFYDCGCSGQFMRTLTNPLGSRGLRSDTHLNDPEGTWTDIFAEGNAHTMCDKDEKSLMCSLQGVNNHTLNQIERIDGLDFIIFVGDLKEFSCSHLWLELTLAYPAKVGIYQFMEKGNRLALSLNYLSCVEFLFLSSLDNDALSQPVHVLAANWPPTMQIVRLISQDHMNNKQYVGKADFLVFRAMNQHGFLGQLQEKKLCAVIQLPSQTLLLSVSDKACRLIGMLFPGDMVVFKPQISSQQQQQLQPQQHPQLQQQQPLAQLQQQQPLMQQQIPQLQQQQQQQQQQIPQLQQPQPQQQQMSQLQLQQQQQQQQQPQPMVGTGMNQAYIQGGGRSQLLAQGQVSSQGQPSMPGGAFMN